MGWALVLTCSAHRTLPPSLLPPPPPPFPPFLFAPFPPSFTPPSLPHHRRPLSLPSKLLGPSYVFCLHRVPATRFLLAAPVYGAVGLPSVPATRLPLAAPSYGVVDQNPGPLTRFLDPSHVSARNEAPPLGGARIRRCGPHSWTPRTFPASIGCPQRGSPWGRPHAGLSVDQNSASLTRVRHTAVLFTHFPPPTATHPPPLPPHHHTTDRGLVLSSPRHDVHQPRTPLRAKPNFLQMASYICRVVYVVRLI